MGGKSLRIHLNQSLVSCVAMLSLALSFATAAFAQAPHEGSSLFLRVQANEEIVVTPLTQEIKTQNIHLAPGTPYVSLGNRKVGIPYRDGIALARIQRIKKNLKPNGQLQSYLNEVEFALKLAESSSQKETARPWFRRFFNELKQSWSATKTTLTRQPSLLEPSQQKFNALLESIQQGSHVDRLEKVRQFIKHTYHFEVNHEPLLDQILFIPFDQSYFAEFPEARNLLDSVYDPKKHDLHFWDGHSGEGLSRQSSSDFANYIRFFISFRLWLQSQTSSKLLQHPTSQWILRLDPSSLDKIQTLIFVHHHTWSASGRWADYVPIDQSFAGFQSNALLSVMIHELNVNCPHPFYFPEDTHNPISDALAFWQQPSLAIQVDHNPSHVHRALGQNMFISLLYLKMQFEFIKNETGRSLSSGRPASN